MNALKVWNYVQSPKIWHKIDVKGMVVGRVASRIATLLQGKHKPTYLPERYSGDGVVIVNAKDIVLTGAKWEQKMYRWHTGYPGGLKEVVAKDMRDNHPDRVLRKAVLGMLPRNKIRKIWASNLLVHPGPEETKAPRFGSVPNLKPKIVSQFPPHRVARLPEDLTKGIQLGPNAEKPGSITVTGNTSWRVVQPSYDPDAPMPREGWDANVPEPPAAWKQALTRNLLKSKPRKVPLK
eukprot:TRINITY_DN1148_c0_g1_i1.p1 TRINITY_DN1148_c0_g1~~TRINITY_DN1148_c0_g1_i1.p1  ORF type:complete len:236 (-),score=52.15 TRINITY_DN1148_c0_g1_i1:337-1044(-)